MSSSAKQMCMADELMNIIIVQLQPLLLLSQCININEDEESDAFLFLVCINVEFRPTKKNKLQDFRSHLTLGFLHSTFFSLRVYWNRGYALRFVIPVKISSES